MKFKFHLWQLPLLSVVLTTIAILVPAWSTINLGYVYYYWSWGLLYETNYKTSGLGMANNANYLTLGISFTILEIISIYILLSIAYLIWKDKIFARTSQIFSLFSSFLLILSASCLIAGAPIIEKNWLEKYDLGLALILPFFSAFFALVCAGLSSKYLPK